jgi:hypothetical protein
MKFVVDVSFLNLHLQGVSYIRSFVVAERNPLGNYICRTRVFSLKYVCKVYEWKMCVLVHMCGSDCAKRQTLQIPCSDGIQTEKGTQRPKSRQKAACKSRTPTDCCATDICTYAKEKKTIGNKIAFGYCAVMYIFRQLIEWNCRAARHFYILNKANVDVNKVPFQAVIFRVRGRIKVILPLPAIVEWKYWRVRGACAPNVSRKRMRICIQTSLLYIHAKSMFGSCR